METGQSDRQWFALRVKSRREKVVAAAAHQKGFEEFLPLCRRLQRWSDRMQSVSVPLFPGYVFCRFQPSDKLRVLTSPGVRSIVSTGRDPQPVDESEISAVRALVESGRPLAAWPFIRVGQKVQISHGPLASLRGVIVRAGDSWRVVVSVEALGCSVSVEVDADMIKPESGVYARYEA